jgi:glycosyltransferase involved in cell wall biosynthesis
MHNYELCVVSGGIEEGNTRHIEFNYKEIELKTCNIVKIIKQVNPDAIIFFVNLKNLYLFPVLFYSKLKKIKAIYWGHGRDLENKYNILKNIIYNFEHFLFDAILLYAECLKKYVKPYFHYKTFIANNTLNTIRYDDISPSKSCILSRFNIKTSRNIICMGRMQKRKRIDDLIRAFAHLNMKDVGLILAGPDTDGILSNIHAENIYKTGAIYGEDAIRLLLACDIYCMPGHVGLSIVDAFYCGLPFITEEVEHAPEICYLKDGINGFIVPKGDIEALTDKIRILLIDDEMRLKFSNAAKKEFNENIHISKMSQGFFDVLRYGCMGQT